MDFGLQCKYCRPYVLVTFEKNFQLLARSLITASPRCYEHV